MAKDDPLENRSEYQPPTSPPRARVPSKRDYQSVKLDPTIDRRRAKTQISQRSMARASRSYTMTAFVAGALGALTASGVYLAMDDEPTETEAAEPRPSGPTRQGTLTPETLVSVRTATAESARYPLSPDAATGTVPLAPLSAAPLRSAEAGRQTHGSAPTPNAPRSNGAAPHRAPEPTVPNERAAPPQPEASASSKAWVDTPPRKVWVQ